MNLTDHFLVSMPQMQDSLFKDSVVYVLNHGELGAFGVIVNNLLDIRLNAVLSQLNIDITATNLDEVPVFCGGPVDETHGLVLHKPGPKFEITHDFAGGVSLSSSRDVLEAIARADEPRDFLLLLGHAGWAPGQLEMEIAANAWLTSAADTEILFHTPIGDRRQAVASLIGIEELSTIVGHSGNA
ncbi:MAG: YqgE/AlgH family protein [Granulosicoccus sp.]|nr:YqgE/AlgH family protein [Granulosicoccus sp.]